MTLLKCLASIQRHQFLIQFNVDTARKRISLLSFSKPAAISRKDVCSINNYLFGLAFEQKKENPEKLLRKSRLNAISPSLFVFAPFVVERNVIKNLFTGLEALLWPERKLFHFFFLHSVESREANMKNRCKQTKMSFILSLHTRVFN